MPVEREWKAVETAKLCVQNCIQLLQLVAAFFVLFLFWSIIIYIFIFLYIMRYWVRVRVTNCRVHKFLVTPPNIMCVCLI